MCSFGKQLKRRVHISYKFCESILTQSSKSLLWIRNVCLDPDPELLFRIRIQLNMKEQIPVSKNVISLLILDFVYCRTVV